MTWGDHRPENLTRLDAIRFIEACRATHVLWAKWEREGKLSETEEYISGALGHHVKWIARYDHVLKELHHAQQSNRASR